ncbi:MAG TPA: ABC transporter ATP-binding protein [Actinomycetota bacterium]
MSAVLETSGLRKTYGSTVALADVDLSVESGTVYGLVGPNGAGKSTLIGLVAGLRRPTGGQVGLGVERRRLAVMPDTPRFDPWLTAHEVVDLARAMVAPELGASSVGSALSEVGLADVARRRVGGFSRGMLQRLGIAATIVSEPELLVFDEPASALNRRWTPPAPDGRMGRRRHGGMACSSPARVEQRRSEAPWRSWAEPCSRSDRSWCG